MSPEAEQRIQDALNLFPSPTMIFEMETGDAVFVNTAAFQYLKDEEITSSVMIKLDPEDTRRWRTGWSDPSGKALALDHTPGIRVSRGETFEDWELIWRNPDTGRVYNLLLFGCILNETAECPKVGLCTYMDISKIIDQREQLKEALLMREEFIRISSHELRTPVHSMVLLTQTLMKTYRRGGELPRADLVRKLEIYDRSITRLAELVKDLLQMSMIGFPTDLELAEVDFCEVVRGMIERVEPQAERQNVTINRNIPKEPILGLWDRARLNQIVSNLLNNAFKYGLGRSVDVDVMRRKEYVELKVRDYGLGVKPEDRQRIFRRFERVISSIQYSGMGLGLWLASEATKLMRGSLWVESPSDGGPGSMFIFHLPFTAH